MISIIKILSKNGAKGKMEQKLHFLLSAEDPILNSLNSYF